MSATQMTVAELRKALDDLAPDWPVFFRRVPPGFGNIEEATRVNATTYASFGEKYPCVIIEPAYSEDEI